MTAGIALRVAGQDAIERRLGALVARLGDVTPLMERIGAVLETSTIERFDSETAPDGSRWKPSFRARATGGKTLTDSARLKQSITHNAGPRRVEVGTNVRYAGVHQRGATIRAKNGGRLKFKLPGIGFVSPRQVVIPKREFLGLSADDREEIEAQAVDYVAEAAPEITP